MKIDTAFDFGYNAYFNNKDANSNPYPTGTEKNRSWYLGYSSAKSIMEYEPSMLEFDDNL